MAVIIGWTLAAMLCLLIVFAASYQFGIQVERRKWLDRDETQKFNRRADDDRGQPWR